MRVRRWYIGLAAAAGLFGILFGGAGTYVGMGCCRPRCGASSGLAAAPPIIWLDNAAGYYKLAVNAGEGMLVDVPASNDTREALQRISQSLPQQVRLARPEAWGLNFRGARLVVVEGRPAAQLVYITDNKAIGPLTLVIGASKAARHRAEHQPAAGCEPAVLAAFGPRLCAGRARRSRLSLGHPQRRRLAAADNLAEEL